MKLLFDNDWLRGNVPGDTEGEPMAGTDKQTRFFIDHGVIHDLKTGRHVAAHGFEDDWQPRLLELLQGLYSDVERLQAEKEGLREALRWALEHVELHTKPILGHYAIFKEELTHARSALGSGGDEQTATKGEVK